MQSGGVGGAFGSAPMGMQAVGSVVNALIERRSSLIGLDVGGLASDLMRMEAPLLREVVPALGRLLTPAQQGELLRAVATAAQTEATVAAANAPGHESHVANLGRMAQAATPGAVTGIDALAAQNARTPVQAGVDGGTGAAGLAASAVALGSVAVQQTQGVPAAQQMSGSGTPLGSMVAGGAGPGAVAFATPPAQGAGLVPFLPTRRAKGAAEEEEFDTDGHPRRVGSPIRRITRDDPSDGRGRRERERGAEDE